MQSTPAPSARCARISTLTFILGYTGTLLTQTITYAAEQFGDDKGAQGIALASVRLDVALALPLAFLADRRGRRWLVVNGTAAACALSALGALAPSLLGLTAAQVLSRGVTSACAVIAGVMLAEEMPAGARAWATSLASMAGFVGAGACVLALPLADLSAGSWRALYVIPLVFIPLAIRNGRHLKETHRYERACRQPRDRDQDVEGHARSPRAVPSDRRVGDTALSFRNAGQPVPERVPS